MLAFLAFLALSAVFLDPRRFTICEEVRYGSGSFARVLMHSLVCGALVKYGSQVAAAVVALAQTERS